MKKRSLSSLFENKRFTLAVSFVVAVVCWAIVVFTISPEGTREIKNVPVTIMSANASYQNLGLDIIDRTDIKVTVKVEGARSVIGSLTPDSIIVTPSFAQVKAAGTYDLPLTATKVSQMSSFTIVSVDPEYVTLRFDNAITKKFTVNTEIVGLSVKDGYLLGEVSPSPAEVSVTGPEKEVNSVKRVVAEYYLDSVLTETMVLNCELTLYDEANNVIISDTLRIDSPTVDLTIPVYKQGDLKLGIEFTNVPDGFDLSTLKYVLSRDTIPVAGVETAINALKTKIVGYVDLTSFKIGETYTFDVTLSKGFVNLDNVESVTVTFPKDDIDSKKVRVTDIRLQNEPANYKIDIVSKAINDVTVIGKAEDIEKLLPGSVVAIVDASVISIENGTYNVPVSFVVTSNNTTWVAGSYSVVVRAEPR